MIYYVILVLLRLLQTVCMACWFSFCEANENTNENTNETKDENIDSGISSNPNSRTGSVLFEKQIPQPVFSMIYEAKEPTDPN